MKRKAIPATNSSIDSTLQEPPSHQFFEKGATLSFIEDRASISHDEAILMARDLKTTNTLCELSFASCSLDHDVLVNVAEGVKENKTLQQLSFEDNNIFGDKGAKAIAGAVKQHATLHRLYLCGNEIGDEGAKALAGAVKDNTTLQEIDLGSNEIGDEGAKAWAKAVATTSTTLQQVYLVCNKIGDEGAQALADAMLNNVVLRNLDLHYNRDISDAVMDGHWTHYPVAKSLLNYEGDGSQSTWDQFLVALEPVRVPHRSRIHF